MSLNTFLLNTFSSNSTNSQNVLHTTEASFRNAYEIKINWQWSQ